MNVYAQRPQETHQECMNRIYKYGIRCTTCDWGFTGSDSAAAAMARTHATMSGKTGHRFTMIATCLCEWATPEGIFPEGLVHLTIEHIEQHRAQQVQP